MTPFGYRVLGFGSGGGVTYATHNVEYLVIAGGGASGGTVGGGNGSASSIIIPI